MNNTMASTTVSYWIDEGWLESESGNKHAYVDLMELAERSGQYYAWLSARYGQKGANVHAAAANFTPTGLRTNDMDHYRVKCMFRGDLVPQTRRFSPAITHFNAVNRVYAHGTDIRGGVEFVGKAGNIGGRQR